MSYYPVHISTIVPKPFYENKTNSYLIEVLVCVNSKDSGISLLLTFSFLSLLLLLLLLFILSCSSSSSSSTSSSSSFFLAHLHTPPPPPPPLPPPPSHPSPPPPLNYSFFILFFVLSDEYSITVTLSVDSTPFSTPQKWVNKYIVIS